MLLNFEIRVSIFVLFEFGSVKFVGGNWFGANALLIKLIGCTIIGTDSSFILMNSSQQ